MGFSNSTAEIVEANDESDRKVHKYSVDDDLSQLIEAIDVKISSLGFSHHVNVDLLQKSDMKKPIKIGISQASGKGGSESVTLKQALRRLCISQASEMAATKRLSKPIGLSGVSEAGMIKRLYASVVVETNKSGLSPKGSLMEIAVVPEKIILKSSEKATETCQVHDKIFSNPKVVSPPRSGDATSSSLKKTAIQDVTTLEKRRKRKAGCKVSVFSSNNRASSSKCNVKPSLVRPVLRNNVCVLKKGNRELTLASGISSRCTGAKTVSEVPSKTEAVCEREPESPASIRMKGAGGLRKKGTGARTVSYSLNSSNSCRNDSSKKLGISKSREKGECSQSSKSSLGDRSSSASLSDESNQSVIYSSRSRPHMSKDARWIAIHNVMMRHGSLGYTSFKLLERIGCGDIGTVYLAELTGSECLFALKVMDNQFLVSRKKMLRAQTEREIMQMLDHPFLPTLYAHFTTDNLSCLVMDYCPGGDLHVLRQKQPGRNFSEPAARFYVAEVLLALEYLHMLGVVYRDLKPENILVREDGHIMLSDFDLSMRCAVSPTLLRSTSLAMKEPVKKPSGPCASSPCIDPLCLQPSCVQAPCFTPSLTSSVAKTWKLKSVQVVQVSPLPQLVVEPTNARSNSFVGTHEYLAPEIIRGDGHGSAVDWWTFGVFLYELLVGRTPFKGSGNEETLTNVVCQTLRFPENSPISPIARDLIRGLLIKEPEHRLGSVRGAAEIKQHPFFDGVNWALIRCAAPPETLRSYDLGTPVGERKKKGGNCLDFSSHGENVAFELF